MSSAQVVRSLRLMVYDPSNNFRAKRDRSSCPPLLPLHSQPLHLAVEGLVAGESEELRRLRLHPSSLFDAPPEIVPFDVLKVLHEVKTLAQRSFEGIQKPPR